MSATLLAEDVLSHANAMITIQSLDVYYRHQQALKSVSLTVPRQGVTAFIGPSGCGKSTLLRCFNRMNDRIVGFRHTGKLVVDGMDPYAKNIDLLALRRKVGMVFQKPNPFPKSIYENVAIGPRSHYGLRGAALEEAVEKSLHLAALWDEVKDSLHSKSGYDLSGGQQQRLCIARMLAVEPDVILMDEPCSALDPISTAKIEDLILELAKSKTVVIVTHNLQQAERVSDNTAFFMYGELIEMLPSREMFTAPQRAATRDYVSGVFG